MTSQNGERELLEVLAEDFVTRHRQGEAPSVAHYQNLYPELAEEIRELFPGLLLMELAADPLNVAVDEGNGEPVAEEPSTHDAPFDELGPHELGDFRILREIRRGAMGVVYEAQQLSLQRRVALKILPRYVLLDTERQKRFLREAQVAARLRHPNIVPVFEMGVQDGIHFYSMQFISGQGLDQVVDQLRDNVGFERDVQTAVGLNGASEAGQQLSDSGTARYFRRVAEIGIQVAEALAYAHREGVLHRDVKPSNLLIDDEGTVWITDFGLAIGDGQEALTGTGDLVGTLQYMAPEQFSGWSDARSDIYSLGLTLYELLTCRPAFADQDRRRLMQRILQEDPRLPRSVNRRIPRDLETIVLKAIAKEPAQRYRGAAELAEDLRRLVANKPITARRLSLRQRSWMWSKRNPTAAALAGMVSMLLMTIVLLSWSDAVRLRAERNTALHNLQRATAAERQARQAEREQRAAAVREQKALELSNRQLYDSLLAQARARRLAGSEGHRTESLRAITEAAALGRKLGHGPDQTLALRNEAVASLALTDLRADRRWEGHPPASFHVRIAFDANLQRYARLEPDGMIAIRRLEDNQQLLRLPGIGGLEDNRPYLRFSPDGQFLAVKGNTHGVTPVEIVLWDLNTSQAVLRERAGGRWHFMDVDFSPDSRRLAFGSRGGAVGLYDIPGGRRLENIAPGPPPAALRFSPDGQQLAVARGPEVQIVEAEDGRTVQSWEHGGTISALAWGAEGRLVAGACANHRVYVWDVVQQRLRTVCRGHQREVRHVTFDQHGDLLLSTSWDSTTRLWNPWSGRQLLVTPNIGTQVSDDDRWLGVGLAGVAVGRAEILRSDVFFTLHGHEGDRRVSAVASSRDGQVFATASKGDGVRLWEAGSGRKLAYLPKPGVHSISFGNTGDWLITSGRSGVHHHRFQFEDGRLQLGTSQSLVNVRGIWGDMALSSNDRFLVTDAGHNEAVVVELDQFGQVGQDSEFSPSDTVQVANRSGSDVIRAVQDRQDQPVRLTHPGVRFFAFSPDGKWVATGPWNTSGVKVWEVATGNCVQELPTVLSSRVLFSPTGDRLITSDLNEYVFWSTDDWQRVASIAKDQPYATMMAYSADGQLLAINPVRSEVKLVEPYSGRELARLTSPGGELLASIAFSPDGRLLMAGTIDGGVQVWNLNRLRSHLAELGLDWDLPSSM